MTYIVAPNGIYSHRAATGNVVWDDTHTCPADKLLIVATLADIASTEYALRRGLSEGNPVAARASWGLPKLALAVWIFIERSDEWAWLIAALAVALLVIAANNVRMAKRA